MVPIRNICEDEYDICLVIIRREFCRTYICRFTFMFGTKSTQEALTVMFINNTIDDLEFFMLS